MHILELKRKDIIDDEWNTFIDLSSQGKIYAKTWYLDAIP